MATPSSHSGNSPPTADRRIRSRHQALLTYIELGEDNGGMVLNISEGGLAVQAVGALIEDQLPEMRFQLSECRNCIETSGRIAWMSESKKVAGLEFVRLSDQARQQIRAWISSESRLREYQEKPEQIDEGSAESELARGIRVSEFETSPGHDSILSSYLAVPNLGMTGTPLEGALRDGTVAREWNSIPVESGEPSWKRSAIRSQDKPTTHEQPRAPQEWRERTLGSRHRHWLAASLALVVFLIIIFSLLRSRNFIADRSKPQIESHMGLKLEHVGKDWRFSWNPDAPVILNATKGHLSITDGAFRKVLDLDSSDLSGATIMYTPLTNDVILQLKVDDADSPRTVSESVRITSGLPTSLVFPVRSVALGDDRTGRGQVAPSMPYRSH